MPAIRLQRLVAGDSSASGLARVESAPGKQQARVQQSPGRRGSWSADPGELGGGGGGQGRDSTFQRLCLRPASAPSLGAGFPTGTPTAPTPPPPPPPVPTSWFLLPRDQLPVSSRAQSGSPSPPPKAALGVGDSPPERPSPFLPPLPAPASRNLSSLALESRPARRDGRRLTCTHRRRSPSSPWAPEDPPCQRECAAKAGEGGEKGVPRGLSA